MTYRLMGISVYFFSASNGLIMMLRNHTLPWSPCNINGRDPIPRRATRAGRLLDFLVFMDDLSVQLHRDNVADIFHFERIPFADGFRGIHFRRELVIDRPVVVLVGGFFPVLSRIWTSSRPRRYVPVAVFDRLVLELEFESLNLSTVAISLP